MKCREGKCSNMRYAYILRARLVLGWAFAWPALLHLVFTTALFYTKLKLEKLSDLPRITASMWSKQDHLSTKGQQTCI